MFRAPLRFATGGGDNALSTLALEMLPKQVAAARIKYAPAEIFDLHPFCCKFESGHFRAAKFLETHAQGSQLNELPPFSSREFGLGCFELQVVWHVLLSRPFRAGEFPRDWSPRCSLKRDAAPRTVLSLALGFWLFEFALRLAQSSFQVSWGKDFLATAAHRNF